MRKSRPLTRLAPGSLRPAGKNVSLAIAGLVLAGWAMAASANAAGAPLPSSLRATLESASASPLHRQVAGQWRARMEPRLARFSLVHSQPGELLQHIYQEARLAGLPPSLVLALIEVESAFQPDAESSAGAVGLMQIMPFWVRELGLPSDDLKDPVRNLRYGCTILAHYLAVERGDFTRALARYNGSLGETWYPERVLSTWRRHWR